MLARLELHRDQPGLVEGHGEVVELRGHPRTVREIKRGALVGHRSPDEIGVEARTLGPVGELSEGFHVGRPHLHPVPGLTHPQVGDNREPNGGTLADLPVPE